MIEMVLLGNILEQANKITSKNRQEDYGDPKDSCERIAKIASAILDKKISAKEVVIILIALKLAREQNKHKEDNLVDLAGYAWVLNEIVKDEEIKPKR